MHPSSSPTIRGAIAALMSAALEDLAQRDEAPRIGPMLDAHRWWRQSQQSFVALRRDAWHMPDRVSRVGWLDSFPEMTDVRKLIDADPVIGARVDTRVGTEFSMSAVRRLDWLLVEHLLEPMVVTTRSYQFDEAVFDVHHDRLEAGLLADHVRLVEFLPLNGFISSFEEVELSDSVVLRPMTDRQISAAIRVLAVPAELGGGPNNIEVSWLNQWALMTEHSYPACSGKQGVPEHPIAPPFPSLEDTAYRLVTALRIVCGGSVITTRPIRAQHDDDFPLDIGEIAALPTIATTDLDRPSKLLSREDADALRDVHGLLDSATVRDDRARQTALRRLTFAGLRGLPTDRLIDLIVCAEALFIKRENRTGNKRKLVAEGAENLLSGDLVLGASPGAVKKFMEDAYTLRNAEVHGDDPTSEILALLNRTSTDKLDDVVDDLERVMRRAIYRDLADVGAARRPQ
ncbi:MAG: hypothetical protein ACRDR6_03145 [Pseudonocardiaceae bacterium]